MAEEIIKSSDVFTDDVFSKQVAPAQELLDKVNLLEAGLKSIARLTGKQIIVGAPKTIEEYEQQIAALNKLLETEKAYNQVKKEKIKLTEQEKLANREKLNIEKQEAIIATNAKNSIASLRAQYNLLVIQLNKTSDAKQRDINVTGSLAQQVKILNQNIFTLESSTGNYTRRVGEYERGSVGYRKSIIETGRALGGLAGLAELAGQALGFNTQILYQLNDAHKTLLKAARDLSHVKTEENVQTQVGVALTEEQVVATEASVVATTEQSVASKAAAAAQKVWNYVMSINPVILLVTAVGLLITGIYQLVTAEDAATKAQREHNIEIYNAIEAQKALNEIIKHDQDQNRKKERADLEIQLKYLELTGASLDEIYAQKQKIFEFDTKSRELEKKSLLVSKANIEGQLLASKDQNNINKLTADLQKVNDELDEISIKEQSHGVDQLELTHDLNEEKKKLLKTTKEEKEVIYGETLSLGDLLNLMIKINEQYRDQNTEVAKLIINTGKINQEYDRRKQQENKIAGLAGDSATSGAATTDDPTKKRQQSEIESAKQTEETLFNITKDGLDRKKTANEQYIKDIDKAIEYQQQLALAGQANNLDALNKQRAAALVERAKIEKQAANREKAEKLANLLLDSISNALKRDPKKSFTQAFLESLAEVGIVKAASAGLAGSFEKGTKDAPAGWKLVGEKGPELINDGGGYPIITNEDTKKILGKYDINTLNTQSYLPSLSDKSKSQIVKEAQNEMIVQKLDEMISAVKSKKELQVNWNKLNEIILTEKANGLTTETTYKNTPLRTIEQPFKRGRN